MTRLAGNQVGEKAKAGQWGTLKAALRSWDLTLRTVARQGRIFSVGCRGKGRVGPWLGLHLNRNHVVYMEKSLHVCGCGQGQSRECRRPEAQSIQGRCGEGEKSVLFTYTLTWTWWWMDVAFERKEESRLSCRSSSEWTFIMNPDSQRARRAPVSSVLFEPFCTVGPGRTRHVRFRKKTVYTLKQLPLFRSISESKGRYKLNLSKWFLED